MSLNTIIILLLLRRHPKRYIRPPMHGFSFTYSFHWIHFNIKNDLDIFLPFSLIKCSNWSCQGRMSKVSIIWRHFFQWIWIFCMNMLVPFFQIFEENSQMILIAWDVQWSLKVGLWVIFATYNDCIIGNLGET